MDQVTAAKLVEDVESIVRRSAGRGPRENPAAVPLSALVGALRGGGPRGGWAAAPESGRRWTLSTHFLNWDFEDLLEKSGRVKIVKVMEKAAPSVCRMRLAELVESKEVL